MRKVVVDVLLRDRPSAFGSKRATVRELTLDPQSLAGNVSGNAGIDRSADRFRHGDILAIDLEGECRLSAALLLPAPSFAQQTKGGFAGH